MTYSKNLRQLCLVSPTKRKLNYNLIADHNDFRSCYKDNEAKLF